MKKVFVVVMATAASFVAARKIQESQESKNSWSESTDSI